MRPIDAQRIEQTDAVRSHVRQGVRHAQRQAAAQGCADIRNAGLIELAGQAAVAIVKTQHAITAGDKRLAELDIPATQLRTQPHDQQDDRR